MRKQRILVIDDDVEMLSVMTGLLAKTFHVTTAATGKQAIEIFEATNPDLTVLDLILPDVDGFTVCQKIRATSQTPIIVLSARTGDRDKVRALDLGADDYLTKPFSIEELQARIRAVMRRSEQRLSPTEVSPPPVDTGHLRIDFGHQRVTVNGSDVRLTPTEFSLLRELASNPGKLLPHGTLLQRVWGPEYRHELDYLRVFIRRLRRKIEPNPDEPEYILTESRAGYRFRSLD
ncbi:MAG TPA: response regulator transcription factor [Chloroflexota bacterium]|nr:response regulator transcription factor [Chloroflexota bacterium]